MNSATGAEQVVWDLSDLYAGADDPKLVQDLRGTLERADALGQRHRGRVAELKPSELRELLQQYEALLDTAGRAGPETPRGPGALLLGHNHGRGPFRLAHSGTHSISISFERAPFDS